MEEKRERPWVYWIMWGILLVNIVLLLPLTANVTECIINECAYGVRQTNLGVYGIGIFILVAIGFYIITWILYRRKEVKSAGISTFIDFVKSFFVWNVGIVGGVIGGVTIACLITLSSIGISTEAQYVLSDVFFYALLELVTDKLWYVLCVLAVGISAYAILDFGIFKLVLKKSRKIWIGCMEFFAVAFLYLVGVWGLAYIEEKSIPEISEFSNDAEIENGYIDMDDISGGIFGESTCRVNFYGEDIQKLIDIHEKIVANLSYFEQIDRESMVGNSSTYERIKIRYFLSDGTELSRSYRVPYLEIGEEIITEVIALEMAPERLLERAIGDDYKELTEFDAAYISIAYYNMWRDRAVIDAEKKDVTLTSEECEGLYQAIIADAMAGNLLKYNVRHLCDEHTGDIESDEKTYTIHMNTKTSEDGSDNSIYFYYGKDCTNILNELVRMGYIKSADLFCWEDTYMVKSDPEIYLEKIFCLEYEKVEEFVDSYLDIGYYKTQEDGAKITEYKTYMALDLEQSKVLYDAIIADWLEGSLIKYNWKDYISSGGITSEQINGNVFEITLNYAMPESNNYNSAFIRYGKDCTNIINAITELKLVESKEDICWNSSDWTIECDERIEKCYERLTNYEDWEVISGHVEFFIRENGDTEELSDGECWKMYYAAQKELKNESFLHYNAYHFSRGDFGVYILMKNPETGDTEAVEFGFNGECPYLMEIMSELGLW